MGQRHQVYLRTGSKFYNPNNPNNKEAKTVAIHHQWLYGHTALRLLHNFMKFYENDCSGSYSSTEDPDTCLDILSNIYSCDFSTGYYHTVHNITKELIANDPRNGDNNNGITVIDIEDGVLKYCFLSLTGLECMDSSVVSPYDDWNLEDHLDLDLRLKYENYQPIDAHHWIQLHYGRDWLKKDPYMLEVEKLVKYVCGHELLTVQRLAEIFPSMVSKTKGEGLYLDPNSINFIRGDKNVKKPRKTKSAII
jgi:hypothetical protein